MKDVKNKSKHINERHIFPHYCARLMKEIRKNSKANKESNQPSN